MLQRFMLTLGLALVLGVLAPSGARAASAEDLVRPLQARWAEIRYQLPDHQQAEAYHALAEQARRLSEAHPDEPSLLIWEGIIVSSEAGARGGLGALSLAKRARMLLEESLKLDETAMQGSAYTSLGTLYAKVPRRPISFGDKDRAEELFRRSLAINPDGIDPNFLYGEYLAERGRVAEARAHLEKALAAPPRPGRELADAGRREEAEVLLNAIAGKT